MRGARFERFNKNRRTGIIPADAGSTWLSDGRIPYPRDHPRGCGEHRRNGESKREPGGSSPRMRGARIARLIVHVKIRIIPADAGSTTEHTCEHTWCSDHPRGCGEHVAVEFGYAVELGSSPRMRGARPGGFQSIYLCRIIPADAGSTQQVPHYHQPHRDHPRGCGEHANFPPVNTSYRGSSPRMRGAPG